MREIKGLEHYKLNAGTQTKNSQLVLTQFCSPKKDYL